MHSHTRWASDDPEAVPSGRSSWVRADPARCFPPFLSAPASPADCRLFCHPSHVTPGGATPFSSPLCGSPVLSEQPSVSRPRQDAVTAPSLPAQLRWNHANGPLTCSYQLRRSKLGWLHGQQGDATRVQSGLKSHMTSSWSHMETTQPEN